MKRSSLFAIALALILTGASTWAGDGHHRNAEKHLDRMSQKLDLDDSQREQFGAIMSEQQQKYRSLGQQLRDQGAARDSDEARALRTQAHEETRARLSTVLSAEQLVTFDEMQSKRKQHREHKRHREHRDQTEEL